MKILLAAALIALPAPALAFEGWGAFYAEIYGGGNLGGQSTYSDGIVELDFDMEPGSAFGASFGAVSPVPGLAFEFDIMRTDSEYTLYPGGTISTLSFMGNAEYAVPVGDMFELYGAVGLGIQQLHYDYLITAVGWGAAYQLAAGARASVTENIAVFGEYKMQNTFDLVDTGTYSYGMPTHNLLAGIRVSTE